MADYLNIAGRIRTTASDGVAIEAQEVKDITINKSQQEINSDVQTELGDRYTKEETYNREELNELITTPDVNYVSVVATSLTTAVTDLLPATGAADTIYRVGNWDGTQYDTTMYSLYAWNGSAYVCLAVRSFVGEVYDISVNHPDGQGDPTPYADLTAALGTSGANIPASIRRGGMSIKFIQGTVQSSDNKYVQARCMAQNFTTDVTQWQGVDDVVTMGSKNLVESGAVGNDLSTINREIFGEYEVVIKWNMGFINALGTIMASSQSQFSQPFLLKKGDTVTVGTQNTNIAIISTTNADSLSVGDSVTVLEKTSYTQQFETHSYTAETDMKIVVCVLKSNYTLSLFNNESILNKLETKVDKVTDKSLIDSEFAASQSVVENLEYMEVETDSEYKILGGRKTDGTKFENLPFEIQGVRQDTIDNPEFMEITTDSEGNIIEGINKDGKYYEQLNIGYANIAYRLNFSQKARQRFIEDSGLHNGNWIVPSYYNIGGYLNNKIRVISDLIRKTIINGDVFYFVTDTHWERNQQHSPAILKQMNRLLNIPKLLHGGDVYHSGLGYDRYAIDCVNWFRYAIDTPNKAYFTDGNHEYINGVAKYGDVFAETRIFLEDVVFGGVNKNYYYFDNLPKKIRYICLYSYGEYRNGNYANGYEDSAQMDWLANVAMNVEEGWRIIIFTHYSIKYDFATSTVNGEYAEPLFSVIDNYSGNGEILAIISGHTHYDIVSLDTCRCPVIVTTCDHNDYTLEKNEFSDLIETRKNGTIGEQAFDIVVFDSDNSIMNFCRIGSRAVNRVDTFGGDAQVDYRSVFIESLTVGTSKALETLLTGTITWRSSDNGIMSVSNGIVTANAAGVAAITASSNNGESQSFFIKVI